MEEKAHAYVDLGLKVIPIKPGSKVPLTEHGSKDATDDHEIVHAWWERWPSANIGIATGHGVDVIDLDGWQAQQEFDMIKNHPAILGCVMTPRDGGLHLYVSSTGKGNRAGVLPGVDYRGVGGYVLAPPSVIIPNEDHDYGGEYEWIDDLDLGKANGHVEWMPTKIEERRASSGAPPFVDHDDARIKAYLESAIAKEVQAVSLAQRGQRNHQLNASAFSLGQLVPHLLDDYTVANALAPAARSAGLSVAEIEKTLDHAISDGSKQPRDPDLHDQGWSVEEISHDQWVDEHGGHLVDDVDDHVESLWGLRPELTHCRQFALARLVSPWAVLGCVIMRCLTSVPPWVMLPAFIGRKGNLNAFLAIVGPSGTGKDAALGCAVDAFVIMEHDHEYRVKMLPVGTGEGMVDQFATIEKGEQVARDDPRILFTGLEVNMIKALTSRSGSTLIEILKQAFTGSQLGFTYRNKGQGSVILDAEQYRLCMIIGAQPENIEPLMNDDLGGFPQRLVWLPSTDPSISLDREPEPPPWIIEDQHWIMHHVDIVVPDMIKDTIESERVARSQGKMTDDDLEGHYRYVQLKISAGLMIMAGRRMMIEEDWHIADMIMQKSLSVRNSAMRMIKRKHDRKREAEHSDAAQRAKYVRRAEHEEDQQHETVIMVETKAKITAMLKDGPMRKTKVRHKPSSTQRPTFLAALDQLIDEGVIIEDRDLAAANGGRGVWLRLA